MKNELIRTKQQLGETLIDLLKSEEKALRSLYFAAAKGESSEPSTYFEGSLFSKNPALYIGKGGGYRL